jgi:hypothetical protein
MQSIQENRKEIIGSKVANDNTQVQGIREEREQTSVPEEGREARLGGI